MRRTTRRPERQLGLSLQREARHQLAEKTREALIPALADLLLEAYGEETGEGTKTPGSTPP